ncbi:MAG TPA: lysophospholipid acyltransferase family protein [Dermatophilaceae bacterium]|jgi:1-acyl-sn-glycerol-3-phosphate acyltransferase
MGAASKPVNSATLAVADRTGTRDHWGLMLYLLTRTLVAPVARLIYRPVIEGRENIPRSGPLLLASNHLSFIDSFVIPLVTPRRVVFLAKSEYFTGTGIRGVWMRWLFTAMGAVPVQRGSLVAAQDELDSALAVLKKGLAFGIYPEGTRSRDGRLYRGRTGVAWLALTADCPVVPVALKGTQDIQPVGSRVLRIRRIAVRFGEPLDFGHLRGAKPGPARREATDAIMEAIRELSGQEFVPRYNKTHSG